ncbi:hypothetical protein MNBD_BACTEROID02-378 [hydrothermal vent metagenome]|uniref:Uncharacterized protein n=1 Tax=hydrothermal vent metagenome TaxID=652676 RepID=A0A3B0QUZ5_9ZZZZ
MYAFITGLIPIYSEVTATIILFKILKNAINN